MMIYVSFISDVGKTQEWKLSRQLISACFRRILQKCNAAGWSIAYSLAVRWAYVYSQQILRRSRPINGEIWRTIARSMHTCCDRCCSFISRQQDEEIIYKAETGNRDADMWKIAQGIGDLLHAYAWQCTDSADRDRTWQRVLPRLWITSATRQCERNWKCQIRLFPGRGIYAHMYVPIYIYTRVYAPRCIRTFAHRVTCKRFVRGDTSARVIARAVVSSMQWFWSWLA
jgi:hypothetical protein